MTVRFTSLWFVWIGWMMIAIAFKLVGQDADLQTGFAIAYFVGAVQFFEWVKSRRAVTTGKGT